MKILRAVAVAFAVLFPAAAIASPAVRDACSLPMCGMDHCPMSGHCPFC
jgi:hypothetical protein